MIEGGHVRLRRQWQRTQLALDVPALGLVLSLVELLPCVSMPQAFKSSVETLALCLKTVIGYVAHLAQFVPHHVEHAWRRGVLGDVLDDGSFDGPGWDVRGSTATVTSTRTTVVAVFLAALPHERLTPKAQSASAVSDPRKQVHAARPVMVRGSTGALRGRPSGRVCLLWGNDRFVAAGAHVLASSVHDLA